MNKRKIIAPVFASLLALSFLTSVSCSDGSSSSSSITPSLYIEEEDTSTEEETS